MRALYVSQNGMAENLGQSQVLPYLRGLARRGAEIDLLSFELATLDPAAAGELEASLARDGIRWHRLVRTMGTPLHVKVAEAARGAVRALGAAARRHPDIVHGRSYFASAVCDAVRTLTRRPRLLFDCRGMIGDEYVDCGYWTEDRLEYRLVKRYERRLFRSSDGVVVLTRALARWIKEHGLLGARPRLEVVPCCVDLARFDAPPSARERLRAELGLGDAFTLVYSGSLGTWYLEREMAAFAGVVRAKQEARGRRTAFLVLTPSDATGLRRLLEGAGLAPDEVVARRVPPDRMPEHLSAGDVGLSFIQSCFSKKGSSPTKVAEYLACGNVAVVNGDIGDQADLAAERDACVVLSSFDASELERAADAAIALAARARDERLAASRDVARRHFGLEEVGVARYAALYEALARL